MIGTGDLLPGRRVSNVVFSREGLNDRGQLAFTASFDDGSAGVFLATPVPEPDARRLLLVGVGAMAWRVARRRPAGG